MIAGPIWLGDNSSVTKRVIERLYACSSEACSSEACSSEACSSELDEAGQYAYYGRVGRLPDHRQRRRGEALRDELLYSLPEYR